MKSIFFTCKTSLACHAVMEMYSSTHTTAQLREDVGKQLHMSSNPCLILDYLKLTLLFITL